ncbi:hypothetical protein CCUS01_10739, partial [Colletotrichum cuscutae]
VTEVAIPIPPQHCSRALLTLPCPYLTTSPHTFPSIPWTLRRPYRTATLNRLPSASVPSAHPDPLHFPSLRFPNCPHPHFLCLRRRLDIQELRLPISSRLQSSPVVFCCCRAVCLLRFLLPPYANSAHFHLYGYPSPKLSPHTLIPFDSFSRLPYLALYPTLTLPSNRDSSSRPSCSRLVPSAPATWNLNLLCRFVCSTRRDTTRRLSPAQAAHIVPYYTKALYTTPIIAIPQDQTHI